MAGGGYVLAQILTLAAYLILARVATPQDFGEFAAGSVAVSIGVLLTESGMMAALIHRRDRLEEAASTAVVATFTAGLGFSLLALATSPLIGAYFESERIAAVAAAVSGLILLRTIRVVPEALLQRRFSFLRRLVIEPVGVIAFGITAVIATSEGMGVWGLVLGYYAGAVADVVLSWSLVQWRPDLRLFSIAMWRELVGYGRHVLAATAIVRLGDKAPVVLIGRFVGTGPLGQFHYANRVGQTPLALVVSGAAYVLFPAFARISDDNERLREAFLRSLRWMSAVAIPLGMILLPLGVPMVVTVFGEVWRDAGEAVMALSGYVAASALITLATEAFKAAGHPQILTRVHAFTGLVAVACMAALLPFGLVGVTIGMTLGTLAGATYALARVRSLLVLRPRSLLGPIAAPLTAALLMAAALLPVEHLILEANMRDTATAALILLAETALGAIIYLAALRVLSPALFGDASRLLADIRQRPSRGATATSSTDLSVTR